jgi:hypothetical protein
MGIMTDYRGDVTAPGSKDDFVKTATRLPYFDNRGLRDLALSNDLGGTRISRII